MTKGARPWRTWSIKSRDGVTQGSYQPQVTVQIVASLGLAALGQVPTPGPISSGQGSCGLGAELTHWEGLGMAPQPGNSTLILQMDPPRA